MWCCLRISGGGCCCFSGFCGESVGLHRSPILCFVDAIVFWVCESLWVSVGFSASASVFFFYSSGGGWYGYKFAGLRWKSVSLLDR